MRGISVKRIVQIFDVGLFEVLRDSQYINYSRCWYAHLNQAPLAISVISPCRTWELLVLHCLNMFVCVTVWPWFFKRLLRIHRSHTITQTDWGSGSPATPMFYKVKLHIFPWSLVGVERVSNQKRLPDGRLKQWKYCKYSVHFNWY